MSIYVPCNTCKKKNRCPDYDGMHVLVARAFGNRQPSPECADYIQVECSYDRPSPRPFRSFGIQDDDHGSAA